MILHLGLEALFAAGLSALSNKMILDGHVRIFAALVKIPDREGA